VGAEDGKDDVYIQSTIDERLHWTYDTSNGAMRSELPHGPSIYINALDAERLWLLLEFHKALIIAHSQDARLAIGISEDDCPTLQEQDIMNIVADIKAV